MKVVLFVLLSIAIDSSNPIIEPLLQKTDIRKTTSFEVVLLII